MAVAGSRFGAQIPHPWLLLLLGDIGSVTADVISHEISVHHGLYSYGSTVRLGCELVNVVQRAERYPGEMLWPAVQAWERPGRPMPPDIVALRELVRRHQAEYDEIVTSEAVLRALETMGGG